MQFAKFLSLATVASAAAVAKSPRDDGLSSNYTGHTFTLQVILTRCSSFLRNGLLERNTRYRGLRLRYRPERHRARKRESRTTFSTLLPTL